MSTTTRLSALATMTLALMAGVVHGDVIVDQSPFGDSGYYSDVSAVQIIADNFSLGSVSSPDSITFWGSYFSGNTPLMPDQFSVAFYEDSAGLPGPLIVSLSITPTRVATGGLSFGMLDVFEYNADFAQVSLAAGTYWVSIVNDSGDDANNRWIWSTTANSYDDMISYSFERSRTPTRWNPSIKDMSFVLKTTAVPEPSSIALGGLAGLVGICRLGIRRKVA